MTFFIDFIIIGVIFLFVYTFWWYMSIPSNLPPGPRGLPIFGSCLKTWKSSCMCKQLLKWTDKYGPVYKMYIGNQLVVVLGDYNTIQEALVKQSDIYAGRPHFNVIFPEKTIGAGITNSEGDLWKIQRRFALTSLRNFDFGRPNLEPKIQDETQYLLEAIEKNNGKPFDVNVLVYYAISNIICLLVFGKRYQYDDEKFNQVLAALRLRLNETEISTLTPFVFSKRVATLMSQYSQVKRLKNLTVNMVNFFNSQTSQVVENFKKDPDNEPSNYIEAYYAQQQAKCEDNWTFTDQQLVASVANLFVAGTDNSATTLSWAIFLMAHFPEIQEKIYEEIENETGGHGSPSYADRSKLPYTEATINEIHRYASIFFTGVMRRTSAPSKVGGYDIPKGTAVVPFLTAVHRDPKVYPNPDQFDPTRFLCKDKDGKKQDVFKHLIPFQVGKRICPGESLANMEMFLIFTGLISKFKFYFSPDEPKPPMEAQASLINAPIPFKVCAQRRLD